MILTSDSETLTYNNGNPFDQRAKVVCIGYKDNDSPSKCLFNSFKEFEETAIQAALHVLFNAKFDLHHYRRLGFAIGSWKIWCCQVAEFILSGQTERFPSLEATATKYGLGHKVDKVKLEFWDEGINTDAVPPAILSEYCRQDVDLTYQIYLKQLEQFQQQPALFKLFKLMCQDLLVLEEMEWNGLKYNPELCKERSKELTTEIQEIQEQLSRVYDGLRINFASNDQLSSFLYGGPIYEESKELIGSFKTGLKAGQPKYKNIIIEHQLPRLVEPLKGSETKKIGYYKTDEGTLRKLKGPAAKKFVAPLLRLAELDKLVGTYYSGIPELAKEHHWPEGMIHGSFHQCVAQTGRLSSSKPNLQNFAGSCEDIFISRYDD